MRRSFLAHRDSAEGPQLITRFTDSNLAPLKEYLEKIIPPKEDLSGDLADQIKNLSHNSSLKYHPLALLRLQKGELLLFSESYPELSVPCNGARAGTLYEIGAWGGPCIGAAELNVELTGVRELDQIRAIRRIRPILPELIKVQVSEDCVTLTHYKADRGNIFTERGLITKELQHDFPGRRVEFVELGNHSFEEQGLLELTRPALQKIFHAAWNNGKNNSAKHIQSLSLDVNSRELTFIEQGPANPKVEKGQTLELAPDLCLNSKRTRYDGQVWQDSARAYLLGCQKLPENLRITTHGHEMCITALINPEDIWPPKRTPGPNRLPYEVRPFSVDNSNLIEREIFELLPADWNFKGIQQSPCGTKIFINAEAPLGAANLGDVVHLVESKIKQQVFLPSTRFTSLDFHDPKACLVLEQIPFGVVPVALKVCQVTGEIEIRTAHSIPEEVLETAQRKLGFSLSNTYPKINSPIVIKEPVTLISTNQMTPAAISDICEGFDKLDNLKTLTIHGGSQIGGSSLTLGHLLLDCGGLINEYRDTKSLENLLSTKRIRAAFITHSHLDHVGAAFKLAPQGIPVFMHYGTAVSSSPILLEQTRINPTFTKEDHPRFYKNVLPIPYGYPLKLSKNLSVTLVEAGHVTGSSMVVVDYKDSGNNWRAVYTSDLQSYEEGDHHRIYPGAAKLKDIDVLIIEATNGMQPIEPRQKTERALIDAINAGLESGRQVLLPTLATKGPELLTLLVNYIDQINAPVFVDGTALRNATDISDYLDALDPTLFISREWTARGWHGTSTGKLREISTTQMNQFFASPERRVVVMSGGMGQGSAERHIKNAKPEDTVIFTSYQAPGTLGSRLLGGTVPDAPKALLKRLTGHISGPEILKFVASSLKPGGQIILTHGSPENKLQVKAALIRQGIARDVIIGEDGISIDL